MIATAQGFYMDATANDISAYKDKTTPANGNGSLDRTCLLSYFFFSTQKIKVKLPFNIFIRFNFFEIIHCTYPEGD